MKPAWRRLACSGTIAILLGLGTAPASAKIVQATRTRGPGVGLLIGSGFEIQSDSEQTEYGLPFLVELAITPRLAFTAEPTWLALRPAEGEALRGFDDLETTMNYEFVSERRHRPAVALEAGVQWSTASHEEFASGGSDVLLGLLVNKEFIPIDAGLDLRYTRVGLPSEGLIRDDLQISLAGAWHASTVIDLTAELLGALPVGPLRGEAPVPGEDGEGAASGGPETEFEVTIGLAQNIGRSLQLDQGVTLKSDGSWQAILAWEWDFGAGR